MQRFRELLIKTMELMMKQKRAILSLSVVVVFITTYLLILPAFTLEKQKAAEQGGIDVPGIESTSEDYVSDNDVSASDNPSDITSDSVDEDTEAEEEPAETVGAEDAGSESSEVTDQEASDEEADPLTFDGEYFRVSVIDKENVLPENTEIRVEEIIEEDDEETYNQYRDDSIQALNDDKNTPDVADLEFAHFYDIKLYADGEVIDTPDDAVDVRIEYDDEISGSMNIEDPDRLHVIHFAENKRTGEVEPEILDSKSVEINTDRRDNLTDTTFEAQSFSVYAVVYTVDFHWEVNGKTYDFSIPGGGFVSFSDIVEYLGIADKDTSQFVSDVENVESSTPDLLWVSRTEETTTVGDLKKDNKLDVQYSSDLTEEKIDEINAQTVDAGDWALISMQPFTSEEVLKVTMKDGEQFEIHMTDGQLRTYTISDKGDTYEIILTYDDTAEIPDDAELHVREINKSDKEYKTNVKATNKQLKAQNEPEISDPVQFDISIISNGKEIEPKEGSTVNVEIKLVPEVFNKEQSGNTQDKKSEMNNTSDDEGEIWYNGEKLNLDGEEGETNYTVSHIKDDGKAEIIGEVSSSVDKDERIVLEFATDSFSDYTVSDANGINGLPNTIYVGDVIYLFNMESTTFSNNGTVKETRFSGKYREIRAENAGTLTISKPSSGWWDPGASKTITVLPARTGTTPPPTIETIDNASIGLTLNLFDYDLDDYLNDRFNNQDFGNDSTRYFENHGINTGHKLKFWGSGITSYDYDYYNRYVEHGVTSIVNNTTDTGQAGGYPVLKADNSSLSYLFTPSDGTDKKAYTNVDGLFKKEGDYYVYDSNQNYAWYNPATNEFEVYNRTYYQHKDSESGGYHTPDPKPIGFFPFHNWDEGYDLYVNWNKNLNHHFGMSMSVPFSLPKDPKAVKDSNGQPIVFEFSGDDDLWVFIDGKLAMDIGGIHQPTSGTINFMTGEVIVNGQSQTGFDFSGLYDGEKHTLQVFYIERGGCDSNCMIKFNMTQYGDVEFDKVDADDNTLLAGAVFGLYKDDRCTIPLTEELKNGGRRAFIVETDENGHAKLEDVPLGDYYLKEIHAPDGYPIAIGDGTVRVRVYLDSNGNVKTSVNGEETNAKILNTKPAKINLGLKKEWQDADGHEITAPDGVSATFEIKRIRTYETYTEREVQGHGEESSHLTVGWIHNNRPYEYEEFDLVAGSQATVSWSLADGYTGKIGCLVNGTEYTKSANPNNIYSQGITMPAAGQTSVLYIIDESENGDSIKNINVAGSQFYGNSGGGFIHEFHTITEPDPDFTYTGTNVTNNQVTLPINENTWQYLFSELPSLGTGTVNVDGKNQKVTYKYSYYIEEVSSNAPEGTTVIYKDTHDNVISSPTDAETHTSGTETVINKVPFGYLKIEKKVTYNGSDQNLTAAQKSKMAGEYKFKIYTKEECGAGDAVQDPDAAAGATDKDMIITITIDEDGQAVSSDAIKLLAGNYWIKEIESSNPMMLPVSNPIAVTVTKDDTNTNPVISTLTNNYDENNGPDKIVIDIEKKFQGLDAASQVPANFQLVLEYKVGNQTKTVTLENHMATGTNGESIIWTPSGDGFTWHWKVGNIDPEAKDFRIKEANYDKAKGYDWQSAALNGTDITSTAADFHDLSITAPVVSFGDDVKTQRVTSDSEYNRAFFLLDDDILLTALTAHQGSLVISKKPLNLMQRKAVEANWPGKGSIKKPPIYFSIEEHPDGFTYGGKKIVFDEQEGKTVVKFTSSASSQEAIFVASYTSQEALNIANLTNNYEEVPITIDIVKVDKANNAIKLTGAVFTLRQLADEAPTSNGTLTTLSETDSLPTDAEGKTSFSNLTHGYYEITEKAAPEGYVKNGDTTFYFKIDSGEVKWLEKGDGKPSTWQEVSSADMVSFEKVQGGNYTFTVKNESGAVLPMTGGIGTTVFYILGTILVLTGGIYFAARKRILGR